MPCHANQDELGGKRACSWLLRIYFGMCFWLWMQHFFSPRVQQLWRRRADECGMALLYQASSALLFTRKSTPSRLSSTLHSRVRRLPLPLLCEELMVGSWLPDDLLLLFETKETVDSMILLHLIIVSSLFFFLMCVCLAVPNSFGTPVWILHLSFQEMDPYPTLWCIGYLTCALDCT